ncbi:hypothetical protein BJY04DRAFT_178607 [Aspergillus karnatakaensis]|uniref:uncharacterized protein n=1 Tax=Aspergillus karnatakaensis TaxID=1810916 RepID=UPI003CCE42BE
MQPFANLVEFLVDLVAVDRRSKDNEGFSRTRIGHQKKSWSAKAAEKEPNDNIVGLPPRVSYGVLRRTSIGSWGEITVLAARSFKATMRDLIGPIGAFISAISLAVINDWIFFQLDGSLAGIRSRQGSLYIRITIFIVCPQTYKSFIARESMVPYHWLHI